MRKALRRFLARLTGAVFGRDERRLREEVEEYLDLQTAENMRRGLSPAEARRQAVLKFGPVEAVKEHYRDQQHLPWIEHAVQDLRYSVRQLHKSPLFTLTATLSLAVGLGANTTVFALVDRLLLRSLPVSHPEELVFLVDQRIQQQSSPRFSYPFYSALRDNNVLEGLAARFSLPLNAEIDRAIVRVRGELVSGNYFKVIGAGIQAGRSIGPEDDATPGVHAVAVISGALWQRSFGSDSSVLGRDFRINDHPFTIIGVAAPGFYGTETGLATDIWIPLMMQREIGRDFLTDARTNWLEIIGRMRSGVSLDGASTELTAYLEHRAQSMPAEQQPTKDRRLILLPGDKGNSTVRRELGPALKMLLLLTSLGLVLACINLAGLLAVRLVSRQKEIAVRLALGARRSRLARQFLMETLVLVGLGGLAGLFMAPWTAGWLVSAQAQRLAIDSRLDLRVFLFSLGVSVLTTLVVGLAPILASRKVALAQAFSNTPMIGTSRRLTVHDVVVTAQIAASLTMLVTAGLLVQSLRGLSSVNPGFRADDLHLLTVDPRAAGYDEHRVEGFWRATLDRLQNVRGVQSASLAGTVPLVPGRQRQPWLNPISGEVAEIDTNFVGPRYFGTLGIPVLRGREFDERDGKASTLTVIVNERLARMFWPEQDPIGQMTRLPGQAAFAEVVGVVKDVKYRDLRGETGPMFYRPLLQTSSTDAMTLHVRASGEPGGLAGTIRREVQAIDPHVPVFGITTLEDQLNASFAQTRQAAVLTGGFGILALLLSGIGVYGVTALAIGRRRHEIGVRTALGARPGDIIRLISRRGLILVIVGLGLGLVGSFGFAQVADALLYGVTARDGATFVGMSALLAGVALAAIYVPARAAIGIDALSAIRRE